MPNQRETLPLSEGDQTWLGSTRGITTNRTEYLVPSDFTAQITDGFLPSGTAVSQVDGKGKLLPYVAGTTVFAGFIFTDTVVGVNLDEPRNVPVVDHGRVRTSRLPVAGFEAPAAEFNNTTIVFVD